MSKYKCNCYWCGPGNVARKDFKRDHGGGPEEIPYRKPGRGKGRQPRSKTCKRNNGGPHEFTDFFIRWSSPVRERTSLFGKVWKYREHHGVMVCRFCGKHNWSSYKTKTEWLDRE